MTDVANKEALDALFETECKVRPIKRALQSETRKILGDPNEVNPHHLYQGPFDGAVSRVFYFLPKHQCEYDPMVDCGGIHVREVYSKITTPPCTKSFEEIKAEWVESAHDLIVDSARAVAEEEDRLFRKVLVSLCDPFGDPPAPETPLVELWEKVKEGWPAQFPEGSDQEVDFLFSETGTRFHIEKKADLMTWWAENTLAITVFHRPTGWHRYRLSLTEA